MERTGLEFSKSQSAVENRENGENQLQNHLWCPNDPRGDNDDDESVQIFFFNSAIARVMYKKKFTQSALNTDSDTEYPCTMNPVWWCLP